MAETLILNETQIQRTIKRLACEIVERNRGLDNVMIAAIPRRGMAVARALEGALREVSGSEVAIYRLDVSAHRDDREPAEEKAPPSDVDVEDRDVVLVDDVLYTGRTVRAALDALVEHGRPRSIQLAVLVDRGHREYPIRPDYVGRVIETAYRERIDVNVEGPMSIHLIDV